MDQFSTWFEQQTTLNPALLWKLLFSALIIIGLLIFRFIAIRIAFRNIDEENVKARYHWKNGIKNTYFVLVVLIIGLYWLERIGSLATFLGLLSAGLAIALKDPVVNFAGWIFIIIRKPLNLGDRIQIGDFSGDVIDIRFFQFTINEINNWVDADQSTGRIIHVPNGHVFTYPLANYNQGFSHIWNEISVLVTFESNWQRAQKLLEVTVNKHAEHFSISARKKLIEASKKYMIFYRTLTPIVYLSVKESGVQLTMRYLIDPRKRRTSEHAIWTDVLLAFSLNSDIEFAYPTQRIFYNPQEGKSDAVVPPNFPKE
jgi:small-conductance mechanosensitive channel